MKVPTAAIDSDNGLLGRFNWEYQGKLLITLDENGEFVHNKKGQGHLRSWLCAKQQGYIAQERILPTNRHGRLRESVRTYEQIAVDARGKEWRCS